MTTPHTPNEDTPVISAESIQADFQEWITNNYASSDSGLPALKLSDSGEYCCPFTREAFQTYMQGRIIDLEQKLEKERGYLKAATDYVLEKVRRNEAAKAANTDTTGGSNHV